MRRRLIVPIVCLVWLAGCGKNQQVLQTEYLDKGTRLFDAGKYREASLNYRKALQYDPSSGEAYYRLGMTELKQDNLTSAFQALYRATQLATKDDRPKVEFANLCLSRYLSDNRRPNELREHLERISRQLTVADPEGYDALRLSGYVAMFNGESRAALLLFEKANRKRPQEAPVLLAMSECLFRESRTEEAERLALDLMQKQPGYGPIYDALYAQYREKQRLADAQQILEKKVQNNPREPAYRLQVAAHFASLKKDAQMNQALAALLEQNPRPATARLLVGDFYAKLGRLSEAIEQYRLGASDGGSDKLLYQKRLAEALLAGGHNPDAGTLISQMLREHAEDADVRTKHALVLLASGRREQAQSAAEELTRLATARPNDGNVLYYLGRAHLALGRLPEANTAFLEALRRRNDSVPVHVGLAEVALRAGAPKDAVQYADRALAAEPRNKLARLLRASGMAGLGQYEAARKDLTRLLADEPGLPEALLQLGVIYIAEKKFAEAEQVFRTSKDKIQNDLRPLEGLVETFAFQNRFDRAYSTLQESLVGAPNSVRLRLLLANTAVRAGNLELAIQQHRRILTSDPGFVESHVQLADISLRQDNVSEAIASLERARALAPKSAKVTGLLGFAQDRAARHDDAKSSYRMCLELQPRNPAIQNNLAFLLAETGGDLAEAQRLAEQAVKLAPKNPSYVDTLGWVYLKKNMNESALRIFQNLAMEYPADPTIRYHLGMSLLQTGSRAQAKAELQKALEQQPSRQFEAKIRDAIARLS